MAYVTMTTKVLQQFDLSQGSLGENLLAKDIGDLLDCYAFTGLVVCCRTAFTPVSSNLTIHSWVCGGGSRNPSKHDDLPPFDAMHGLRMNSVDLPNNSVRPLAKLFGHIVALINDEILIEYLEDLSALKICHIMPRCGYLLPDLPIFATSTMMMHE